MPMWVLSIIKIHISKQVHCFLPTFPRKSIFTCQWKYHKLNPSRNFIWFWVFTLRNLRSKFRLRKITVFFDHFRLKFKLEGSNASKLGKQITTWKQEKKALRDTPLKKNKKHRDYFICCWGLKHHVPHQTT